MKRLNLAKTVLALLIITVMVFTAACGSGSGTGGNSGGGSSNGTESNSNNSGANSDGTDVVASGVLTADDVDFDPTDESDESIMYAPEAGLTIKAPQAYLDNQDKVLVYYDGYEMEDDLYVMYFYIYPDTYDNLMTMPDDEFTELEAMVSTPVNIIRAKGDWVKDDIEKWLKWNMDLAGDDSPEVKELGTYNDATIYLYANDYTSDLPDDIKPIFQSIIPELIENAEQVVVTEPVNYEDYNTGTQLSFTTKDVDGNEITSEEIFARADYTLLNCWMSWCGPCVQEMPELEELNKDFSERGGQVVGLLLDGSGEDTLADGKDIIAQTGVTYLNIIDWEGVDSQIFVQAYPTTFFVDSEGNIVGQSIIGADPDGYKERMDELL